MAKDLLLMLFANNRLLTEILLRKWRQARNNCHKVVCQIESGIVDVHCTLIRLLRRQLQLFK